MIFYFSATGNSKRVAERLAEATGEPLAPVADLMRPNPTRDLEGEQSLVFEIDPHERIGIVTPVYFWRLPSIMADFLSAATFRMTDAGESEHDPYTYCVLTYGAAPGGCSRFIAHALEAQGVKLSAAFGVTMPDTFTPLFDVSDAAKVERIVEQSERDIDDIAQLVQSKTRNERGAGEPSRVVGGVTRRLYDAARSCAKFHVDPMSCIGCGVCAESCPAQAIAMTPTPKTANPDSADAPVTPTWTASRCALCLGCLHRCPAFAISYGNGRATSRHGQYANPRTRL